MNNTPKVIWFIGLSGAGKSHLSDLLAQALKVKAFKVERIDGDLRRKTKKNSDFSKVGRINNNLEITDEIKELKDVDFVIVSTISPYEEARKAARERLNHYFEVYLSTPLEICEERDPKGLYKQARSGALKNFTGIDDPFEVPLNPDLSLSTEGVSPESCIAEIQKQLQAKKWID